MRSYEAARTYFSILGFISWLVIIAGVGISLFAVVSLVALMQRYGGPTTAGITGLIPGAAVMFTGFMGLVVVQIGRAGVDSAEYTQQMLKIARDQLEVSRQGLKGSNAPSNSFADAVDATSGASASAYETLTTPVQDNTSAVPEVPALEQPPHVELYIGYEIVRDSSGYRVGEQMFETLDAAKDFVDSLLVAKEPDTELG